MEQRRWYVIGGRFRSVADAWANHPNLPFLDGLDGPMVQFGPFATEEEADRVWLGETRRNVDSAVFRLIVVGVLSERLDPSQVTAGGREEIRPKRH